MFFYALFAMAICLPRKAAVCALCILLVGIVMLGRLTSPQEAPLNYWSDPIILEFALGMILALLYRERFELPTLLRGVLVITGCAMIMFSRADQSAVGTSHISRNMAL